MYRGIDVSVFNGNVDWKKVKNDGISFAVIRSGYGRYEKDEKFEKNYKNAKAVGMPIGIYHYSYANTVEKAKQEAEFVISYLKGKDIDLFVAYDVEDATLNSLSKKQLTDIALAFLDKLTASGYKVCLYSYVAFLKNKFDFTKIPYDIWVAQWNSTLTYKSNNKIVAWQYSDKGWVNGISGRVDLDYYYGDIKKKTITEIAQEVLDGKWGNGSERKKKLKAAGYDYDKVQKKVNDLLEKQKNKKYAKGSAIKLNNTPVYASATATRGIKRSGTYYIYDGENVKGRYRITNSKNFVGKTPVGNYVTGWIKGE